MTTANRVRAIDFWRGAVLIVILVDHIPGNPLEHFTPRNFGLSDSAEAFVFLSGLSVGLIYLPRACKYGFAAAAERLPQARAQDLRRAHRADACRARRVRRRLLAERRYGADRSARTISRLRLARQRAPGPRAAQPSIGIFQHPAALYHPHAVGPAGDRACAAQSSARPHRLRGPLRGRARFRPQSAELAAARRLVLQSLRLAARVHDGGRRGGLVPQRPSAALVVGACPERGDRRSRGVHRDQRRRPCPGPSRGRDGASRCRQAGSRIGAARSFYRAGLSCRRGAGSWANGWSSHPRRYRRRRSKPGPQ